MITIHAKPQPPHPNKWSVVIYEAHVGVVDETGNTICSIPGGRGSVEAHRKAKMIVSAVNDMREREGKC